MVGFLLTTGSQNKISSYGPPCFLVQMSRTLVWLFPSIHLGLLLNLTFFWVKGHLTSSRQVKWLFSWAPSCSVARKANTCDACIPYGCLFLFWLLQFQSGPYWNSGESSSRWPNSHRNERPIWTFWLLSSSDLCQAKVKNPEFNSSHPHVWFINWIITCCLTGCTGI